MREACDSHTIMKYYVYILLSLKNNDIYIGSTANLQNRINLHNEGKVKSTKAYKPWQLLESREFDSRSEAMKQEMFLKTHQQKESLKKEIWPVSQGVRRQSAKLLHMSAILIPASRNTMIGKATVCHRYARSRIAGQNCYT
mgnify:CR=1 FL=1